MKANRVGRASGRNEDALCGDGLWGEGWLGVNPLCGGKSFLGAGASTMEMDSGWAVFGQGWPQGRHWVLGTEEQGEFRAGGLP